MTQRITPPLSRNNLSRGHPKKTALTPGDIILLREWVVKILENGVKLSASDIVQSIKKENPKFVHLTATSLGKNVLVPMTEERPTKLERNTKNKYHLVNTTIISI